VVSDAPRRFADRTLGEDTAAEIEREDREAYGRIVG
jgi:hypothetical protein